jgi:hypothetical protein
VVAQVFNPRPQETEAGFLSSRGRHLVCIVSSSQGYIENPCLKKGKRERRGGGRDCREREERV